MGDLISRSKVIEVLKETGIIVDNDLGHLVVEEIERIPTAYDVEKVVEQLEDAKEKVATEDYCRTKYYIENDCKGKDCFRCCAEYLIEIVRKDGVE